MGREIAIVGAGVIGCSLAYELARRGATVALLDRRPAGGGASQASAGILAPYIEGHPEPVPFGRVQGDDARIAAIGRDRDLPLGELFARIDRGVDEVTRHLRSLDPGAGDRRGTHPTLGEMRVSDVVERMLAAHLEDHVAQLERILEAAPDRR